MCYRIWFISRLSYWSRLGGSWCPGHLKSSWCHRPINTHQEHPYVMGTMAQYQWNNSEGPTMNHSRYGLSQWETMLQCNAVPHCLIPCPEWSPIIIELTVCSGADIKKKPSKHRWPIDSPHKGPVTRRMFLFVDVIMMFIFHGVCHMVKYISDLNPSGDETAIFRKKKLGHYHGCWCLGCSRRHCNQTAWYWPLTEG